MEMCKIVKKADMKVLSKKEEQLIQLLKVTETAKAAAIKMHIAPKTMYNMLYRLRQKYYKARKLVNRIESNKRGHPLIKMLLTDRIHARDEETTDRELEFEEDLD